MASNPRNGTTPKEIALEFLRVAGLEGRPREAYERYVGKAFRHHNPYFPGGREEVLRGMEDASRKTPLTALDVKHAVAEGDLVAVHSHVRQRGVEQGIAVVHLFRFQDGKIVEFWDVGQQVPRDSPNENGMF